MLNPRAARGAHHDAAEGSRREGRVERHAQHRAGPASKYVTDWRCRGVTRAADADENIAARQKAVDDATARLMNVARKWEDVRKELVDGYRKAKVLRAAGCRVC